MTMKALFLHENGYNLIPSRKEISDKIFHFFGMILMHEFLTY